MPVDNGVSKGRQRYKNCVKKKLGNGSTLNGTSRFLYFLLRLAVALFFQLVTQVL